MPVSFTHANNGSLELFFPCEQPSHVYTELRQARIL
jgi:hypothetical protein